MPTENIHEGHRKRLRERFLRDGLSSLTDREALELLLTYAIPRRDVVGDAAELLSRFGSFAGVLDADPAALRSVPGIGEGAAAFLSLLPELFGRYSRSRLGERPRLSDPAAAARYAMTLFEGAHEERAYLVCLDLSGHVLGAPLLSRGTLDETPLYPRKVVEQALAMRAHAVFLAHNHPGGTAHPSRADLDMTRKVADALSAVGIRVLDHLIVCRGSCFSMAKNGVTLTESAGEGGTLEETAGPASVPPVPLGWSEENHA